MRKLLFVFTVLLLFPLALAQEEINPDIGFGVQNAEDLGITNPKLVSMLDIEFIESGTFDVFPKRTTLNELNLELFSFPRNEYYMAISNLATNPDASLEEDHYAFGWEDVPRGDTDYDLSANVKLDFAIKKHKLYQPFPFINVPEEFEIYLEPTDKINSDDPTIKKTANEIILGENDAYIAAYKLAKYVSDTMTYDIKYLGRIEPTSSIINDKIGVCVEYSNLLIALARSVGIPARYISGYSYGNVYGEKFNAHAWTEIYIPNTGWIPFDPTFGEFGWVDMTHIKTQESKGPEDPSLRFTWVGGEVNTNEPNVEVNLNAKEENLPKYVNNEIWLEKETVATGSYNIVWMSLENTQDFYLAPEAFLTASSKIIGKNQQSTILTPKGTGKIGWIIQIPDDLDESFTYTYTITADALFGHEKTTSFFVDPRSEESISLEEAKELMGLESIQESSKTGLYPQLNINLQSPELAFLEERYNVVVELYNSGNAPFERLTVCMESTSKKCENVFLGINDKQILTFTKLPDTVGTDRLFVTITGEGVEESQVIEVPVIKRSLLEKLNIFLEEALNKILSAFR